MAKTPARTLTHEEWLAEAERRFGADAMQWKFVCPICGHVASVQEYKDAGAKENAVAYSYIGRFTNTGRKAFGDNRAPDIAATPCDYTTGGLFNLSPVTVILEGKPRRCFEFADTDKDNEHNGKSVSST
jgi:hypothetical protein